jgi:prevent-host-death family protein
MSVRQFRNALADALEASAPVVVTRHGRPVAVVYSLAHPAAVPMEIRRSIIDAFGHELRARPRWPASPVVERYKQDVDRTLIRENLQRTPEERLRALQELQELADELRGAR